MQFQQDYPKDKKLEIFQYFGRKQKFRSTKPHGAPLEGSTIFLCRNSLGSTAMESCRLHELEYAIFTRTGRKTEKLQRSKLFLSMAFKHGLLEGSTFSSHYISITRAPLESSRLGELKYVISAGQDVRLKNKSIQKCKKLHCATSVHGHCIVHRFRQVRTNQNRCKALFFLNRESHAVQICPNPKAVCSFLTVSRSKLYDPPKWWKQPFIMLQLA